MKVLFSFIFILLVSLCTVEAQVVQLDYWNIKGNNGTDPAINFFGSIDNVDIVFRTNNTEKARLGASGLFFIQKNATAINTITQPNINAACGVFVANSPQTGAINLGPFQEKGRYFYIVNYSGANLSLSHSVQISTTANVNIIGNGQRWCIIWDGLKFIRIL